MRKLLLLIVLVFSFAVNAQTVLYGQSGFPVTLDTPQDGNSLTVGYQILEPLLAFVQGSAELKAGLATSWEANEDASAWIFHIREGVMFHDGTPLNAEAVKFNFDRWNHRDNPYAYADEGKTFTSWTYIFNSYYGEEGYVLESVDVVDEYSVRLNLTQPIGFLPAMVASSYFGIHSPTAVMAGGVEYGTPAQGVVGTGPFKFAEWVDGERVALERNDDYWGDKAQVERLIFRGIESAATRLAELEAGTLDIAVNLSPEDYDTVASSSDLNIATAPADLRIGYLGLHQANKPFDDLRVRQAFAYAIDKEAIVEAFYGDLGAVAGEFVPPTLPGRAELAAYEYDPEKAKTLLADAGYADGFDTEFWYMPVSRPYYPNPKDIAEAVASYLADVGIRVILQTEDWGIYLDDYSTGKFPIYMLGWSADFADPDNFISPFFGASNIAAFGWDSPSTLELIDAARSAGSMTERELYYRQIAQQIYDDMPALPLVNPRTLNATRAGVDGFYPSPLGSVVSLASVTKAE
ncbi:MAG: ABC transporter substrate-binding protein [Deinococcales bacterium]